MRGGRGLHLFGALDRKLLRDLWRLKGQVAAIAVVIGCGGAVLVMALSALNSLSLTAEAYYERYRFAQVFAENKRAPDRLLLAIRDIPGVQTAETRISSYGRIELDWVAEPITARFVSSPERRGGVLNRLAIRAGRAVAAGRSDEVVISEPFALARGLSVGDRLPILINGSRRTVRIVGVALSPEFVYAIAPGALIPDDTRFAVVWMDHEALASAYDLDGAFNSVTLSLAHGAVATDVIAALDTLLERYGGAGAIERKDQLSNWFLMNELDQLRALATVLPSIFLVAAAFLTNTVVARLIATEQREIGLMKAFGFSGWEVGLHYAKFALCVGGLGVLLGWLVGKELGQFQTMIYNTQFHFPFLEFRLSWFELTVSGAIGILTPVTGAVWAVRRAAALTPAAAMSPPTPQSFRKMGGAALAPIAARLDHATRILLRQAARAPVRSSITVTGVALSVAVLMLALQWPDAIQALARGHFHDTMRRDATVAFFEAKAVETRFDLGRLPGVMAVEPARSVPADLVGLTKDMRPRGIVHRGALDGVAPGRGMEAAIDADGWERPTPAAGVLLGRMLADKLGVSAGDSIRADIRTGVKPSVVLPVNGVFENNMGMRAFVNLGDLNRALEDPPVMEMAFLRLDPAERTAFYTALKETPAISVLSVKKHAETKFHETLGETVLIFVSFFVGFAAALGAGTVYNAARTTLSERSRELATLRVLGFTRWEISYILLGEIALLVLIALPLGYAAGLGLIWVMAKSFETELFRVPLVLEASTIGWTLVLTLAIAILIGAVVRRQLDHLDLIAVLKTRE
ncbi:MAG: ABC transporter permease [Alphaproteobacteria bacterium]|nr:ABC transporter permease [Alphaproteobacteria bacterium]